MHGKERQDSLPKLAAKGETCKRIEHREDARKQDAHHKAKHGLTTHFRDVTGDPDSAE
jgi:hypothetical protein